MPTYEYACRDCGEHLEVVQSFSDDALSVCPSCEGSLRKVFSAAGIIFKGSGWHIKDYASKSGGSSASGDESSGSSGDAGSKEKTSGDSGSSSTGAEKSGSSSSGSEKSGSGTTGSASKEAGSSKGTSSGSSSTTSDAA